MTFDKQNGKHKFTVSKLFLKLWYFLKYTFCPQLTLFARFYKNSIELNVWIRIFLKCCMWVWFHWSCLLKAFLKCQVRYSPGRRGWWSPGQQTRHWWELTWTIGAKTNKKDKSCSSHRLWTLSNMKRIRCNLNYLSACMKKFNNEFRHRKVDDLKQIIWSHK